MVRIKHDCNALNVLYAHRQSHARTHASRELNGRKRREEKRRTTCGKKKPTLRGERISGGGQREGEECKREREKEGRLRWSTWKLPVVVVIYGRHTGVTRTLACVAVAAHTHTRTHAHTLYAHSTRERTAITLVWRRSRARARERGQIEPRIEWGKRRVCGATRIHVYTHAQHTCERTYVHATHTRVTAPGPRGQSSHLPDKM